MEMEWNGKWDWENLVAFGSKVIESPKKLQLADWTIAEDDDDEDDDDDDGDTFNLSVSDCRHPSSAKSSVSASTDSSSCKDGHVNGNGMRTSIFRSEGSSGNLSTKNVQLSEISPAPDVSVGSAEALLGLKLGKRTYFENSGGGAKISSFPVMPTPAAKKTKSSAQNSPTCCQVEGCNVDLSLAKEYHRKHRVCDSHSKCPKVIVGGHVRRFCQQCSRFHSLSEFDEKKRSCRRRLSDHNARRRKPQQETIQFNSPQLSTPFYGGTQRMSFLLNNSPVVQSTISANSGWNNSKFTLAKGCSMKSEGDGGIDERSHVPGIRLLQTINMQNGLPATKNTPSVVFNPGSKASLISSSVDAAAAGYGCALSLLSNNSWDESSIQFHHHQLHENSSNTSIHRQPMIPEGVPFSSSEFWPTPHQVQSMAAFKSSQSPSTSPSPSPYDTADIYSNLLN